MNEIKELVKGTTVKFLYYQKGEFWYEVVGKRFKFPVDLEDIGDARLLPEDKGILFMRYIRKHIKNIEEGVEEIKW